MRQFIKHLSLQLFLLMFVGNAFAQVDVQLSLASPSNLTLDALSQRLTGSVINTSSEPITINFSFDMTSNYGLSIQSPRIFLNDIDLEAGEMRQFDYGDWRELFSSNVIILPVAEEIFLQSNQLFKQGNYTICLKANTAGTNIFLSQGCTTFTAKGQDPPEITFPGTDKYELSEKSLPLRVDWFQLPSTHVEYRVEIADASYLGNNIGIAGYFEQAPQIYREEGFSSFSHVVEDVDWEVDHTYAIRVSSYTEVGEATGRSAIHSRVRLFKYISEEDTTTVADIPKEKIPKKPKEDDSPVVTDGLTMNAMPHYPMNSDTIPFLVFPTVVELFPKGNTIKGMMSVTTFSDGTNKTKDLTWNGGAKDFLNNQPGFEDAGDELASLIPTYDINETNALVRGGQYNWSAEVTLEEGDNKDSKFSINPQKFVVGMPKPRQVSPAPDTAMSPGDIKFRWKTAGKQSSRITPKFQLVHIKEDKSVESAVLGDVHEHWVLEVFKSNDKDRDNLVQQFHDKLDITPEIMGASRLFDLERFEEVIYGNLEHTFNMTEEGNYWWRIAWLRNPDKFSETDLENLTEAQLYHSTSLRPFTIGSLAVANTPDDASDCQSNCIIAKPNSTGSTALNVGSTTKIGKFDLKISSVSGSESEGYKGEGIVEIPFLNNLKLKVEFDKIKANADNRIHTGTVTAKRESTNSFVTNEGMLKGKIVKGLTLLEADGAVAKAIDESISNTGRLISTLAGSETALPVGWDFEIDEKRIRLAIVDIDFSTTVTNMGAIALADIPYTGDDGLEQKTVISLATKELCINPAGINGDGKFYVPEDLVINPDGDNVFAIKGFKESGTTKDGVTRDPIDYTFLQWDCNGFKAMNLAMQIKFSREAIVPEDDKGKVLDNGNVIASASFNLKKEDAKFNLISKINFSNGFQLPQKNAQGWSFKASDAWLDLSTVDNPTGLTFPKGYVKETTDPRLANTWKGFWIDKIEVKAPHFIESSNEQLSVTVNDFIIDPKITFSFLVKDLLPLDKDATIEGAHVSVDSLFLEVLQNDFKKGGFTGRMALPIAEDKPSQMFNYRVLFDNAIATDDSPSGLGLVMTAQPSKGGVEIISKGFMMKGKIAETSFIEVGIGRENYAKFELNGTFNISTDFDNDIAKTISLQMPGIKIEGMKFDSSKPNSMFVCDDCFKTSLASPQKTMSGFPLSLESIKGGIKDGNPVLSIEPMISLMGDDDKFAASTKIDIVANMKKVGGKWDFGLKEVDVKAISLDATISKISVKGALEFYDDAGKKGTKGDLAVVLPAGIAGTLSGDFGTYKKPGATAAKFDTKEWYSYWQLDGTIMFGKTGMPFGAVALYGVGGGASYHMTQGALPNGSTLTSAVSSNKDTSKSKKATSSGTDYTPDFDTGLGLKFTSLFGSVGGGKVYNFDVTLSAEFNNNNGLKKLGLAGNARILPDDDKPFTATAPIQAYVHLGLERLDNPDNLLITGDFIVTLNMLDGTLKGIGSATDNPVGYQENILVDATFKSDKESKEWYFIMGTPEKRAGISVSLGKVELASVTGYFLAGNALPQGITLGLPAPTQAFLDIQAKARGGKFRAKTLDSDAVDPSIVNGAGGEINKKASGFQFGLAMSTGASASALFYYDLGIAVGFDLLMKNVESCQGSVTNKTYRPGWYSQGQFYAGIHGEFGLDVDLWFIQGRFPILEASAALLLQGNIPEPVGFKGEGDIAYSILGDLLSGNYHFEMVVGEECMPLVNKGGALDDLDIIQDIKPAGGNEVSVFSKCAATFAISVDKILEIPISKDEVIIVRPFIKKWTLKDNQKNRFVNCKPIQLTNENGAAILEPEEMLDGHRKYTQYLRVEAKERVGSKWTAIIDEKTKKAWYNDETVSFKTGDVPDVIVEQNVVFTYPIHDQKHFLKKETAFGGGLGYVALKLAQDKGKKVFDPSTNKEFIARFVKIDGTNAYIESPLTFTHARKTIGFSVNKLENDQVYLLQLVSKDKVENTSTNATKPIISEQQTAAVAAANNQNVGVAQIPRQDMPLGAVIALQETNINILSNKFGVSKVTMKERKLPDGLVFNPSEKILYEYYFKTSRFDKFEEKVASLSWDFKFDKPGSLAVNENATFDAVWDELPEMYDKEGRGKVKQLINVTIDKNNNHYIKTKVKNLNNLYNSIKVPVIKYRLGRNGISLKDYSEGVDFAYESKFDTPLSKAEIDNSFETEKRNSDKFNTWAKDRGAEIDAIQSANSPVAASPNSDYNNSSYSPTVISGNTSSGDTSSGYQYADYFITGTLATAVKTPNVTINHRLPRIAHANLREMKRSFLPTTAGELDLWEVKEQTVSGIRVGSCHNLKTPSKSTHYVNMYKKRYSDKQLYKYIINKPTGGDFLRIFDRTTYNRIQQIKGYQKNLGYPKYADNGQPIRKSISFILQYQYPIPTGGTSVRMQPGSKVTITN